VLLAALLAVPVVLGLAVPLYASETPALAGIPFFFWFQFALSGRGDDRHRVPGHVQARA